MTEKKIKYKKYKKKRSKNCVELKSNESIKTTKSSNKSITIYKHFISILFGFKNKDLVNQILKLKNKKNEEASKENDFNNYNKTNKLFEFVNFLYCLDSKLNDTD